MEIFCNYLYALLLTEILELLAVGIISRNLRFLKYMFFVNLLTNPIANLCNQIIRLVTPGSNEMIRYFVIELAVVVAEAVLIRNYRSVERENLPSLDFKRCCIYSLALNGLSFSVGCLLNEMILK